MMDQQNKSSQKKRKIIKRKRGEGPSKLYFNSDTQAAIVRFQNADSDKMREVIYVNEIKDAFEKLVENLINIHKFTGLYDSFEDLKHDCVNFLFETIHKFDSTRGTNAFSYFNVVAKNWLIIKTKQKTNWIKKCVSMNDMSNSERCAIEESEIVQPQDIVAEKSTSMVRIKTLLAMMTESSKTDHERDVINSIIEIIENAMSLDIVTKGGAYIYIKEVTKMNHKQLASVMSILKKRYKHLKNLPSFPL